MSMETSVTVRFRTEGAGEVRNALNGVVSEGSKGATKTIREATTTARTQERLARDTAREKIRAEREAAKAATATANTQERAARAKAKADREAAKAATNATKTQERAARDKAKAEEKAAHEATEAWKKSFREQARAYSDFADHGVRRFVVGGGGGGGRGGGGAPRGARPQGTGGNDTGGLGMPGFVMGAPTALAAALAQYGSERVSRAAQHRGVEDVDSLMAQYTSQDRVLQIAAGVGGRPVEELRALVRRGQTQHGISGGDTTEALATLQDQFPEQVQAFVDNYGTLAELGSLFDAGLTGIGKVGALSVAAFGLGNDQMDDAALTLAGSTGKGSVNTSQLAQYYGAVPGLVSNAWGDQAQGMTGVQTFATIAQLSQKSGGTDAAEWSTSAQRFLSEIADPAVQERAERAGINVTTGEGANRRLRSPEEVLNELSTNPALNAPGAIDNIFGSVESQRFVRGMRRGDVVESGFIGDMMATTPEMGRALAAEQLRTQQGTGAYDARFDATRREATVQAGGEERLRRERRELGYVENWEAANMDLPSPLRALITTAAGVAEGVGTQLDTWAGGRPGEEGAYTRSAAGMFRGRMGGEATLFADPRLYMRALLGGDTASLDERMRWDAPQIGQSQSAVLEEANGRSLAAQVIAEVARVTGQGGAGANPFAEGGGVERVVDAADRQRTDVVRELQNATRAIDRLNERLPAVGRDGGE